MRWPGVVAALIGVGLLAGCLGPQPADSPRPGSAVVFTDAELDAGLAAIVHRTPHPLDARRLAPGLTAPTNRWYSGLVFGEQPQPVFPMPLSFALTAGGFAFGLPKVSAQPEAVLGAMNPQVSVDVGARGSVVVSDDPAVVTIEQRDDAGVIGRVTIAQGWPFVAWTAAREIKVRLDAAFEPGPDGLYTSERDGQRYAFQIAGGQVDGTTISLQSGGSVVLWAVPPGQEPPALAQRTGVPTGSSVSYEVTGDAVQTGFTLDGAEAVARRPQQGTSDECRLGAYPSIYGALAVCPGPTLQWQIPRTKAKASLDLGGLPAAQRDELRTQVDTDVAAVGALPTDSYGAGKALQRMAMLLMVAEQVGADQAAQTVKGRLAQALARWAEPAGCQSRETECFVYDPAAKGLIGLAPSFGSDEYNDHHFHYGYFLYAAGVLATYDPAVMSQLAPVFDLVAADIASAGNSSFPTRRNFDAYAGHSWASGMAPFADGNNQESVSEAVNAYAGLSLWAQARGNVALGAEADWMLSLESVSSTQLWLNPDLSQPQFAGYGHRIVSLNWGGKRDYATWFSAEPSAKLGILLIPMSPTSGYLAGARDGIDAAVAEAVPNGYGKPLSDFVLMYAAMAGPEARDRAVVEARRLPDKALDVGLSRSYLLAWLYALRF